MLIAVDLSEQQALIGDPNAIKHINFKRRRTGNSTTLFIIEKMKVAILEMYKYSKSVPKIYFGINIK